jgi:hypothetical protein
MKLIISMAAGEETNRFSLSKCPGGGGRLSKYEISGCSSRQKKNKQTSDRGNLSPAGTCGDRGWKEKQKHYRQYLIYLIFNLLGLV